MRGDQQRKLFLCYFYLSCNSENLLFCETSKSKAGGVGWLLSFHFISLWVLVFGFKERGEDFSTFANFTNFILFEDM